MKQEIRQYKIEVSIAGVDWPKVVRSDTLSMECSMSNKHAHNLRVPTKCELVGIVRTVKLFKDFTDFVLLSVFVEKLGVIWEGVVFVPHGKGAMYGSGVPKKHQH